MLFMVVMKLHPDEISDTVVLYVIMVSTPKYNTIHTYKLRHQLWTLNDTMSGQHCCSIKSTRESKQITTTIIKANKTDSPRN